MRADFSRPSASSAARRSLWKAKRANHPLEMYSALLAGYRHYDWSMPILRRPRPGADDPPRATQGHPYAPIISDRHSKSAGHAGSPMPAFTESSWPILFRPSACIIALSRGRHPVRSSNKNYFRADRRAQHHDPISAKTSHRRRKSKSCSRPRWLDNARLLVSAQPRSLDGQTRQAPGAAVKYVFATLTSSPSQAAAPVNPQYTKRICPTIRARIR